MKILRLALFNIKRRKREAIFLILLTCISMALLCIALMGLDKAYSMIEQAFEETESKEYAFVFEQSLYKTEFGDLIEQDPRVTNVCKLEMLRLDDNAGTSCKLKDGSIVNLFVSFVTEENEKKLSRFLKGDALPVDEAEKLPHPIWMPQYVQLNMGFCPGDEICLTLKNKEFVFQIAGFYETGLFSSSLNSYKCVISREDYEEVAGVLDRNVCMVFDLKDGSVRSYNEAQTFQKELTDKMSELAGKKIMNFGFLFECKYSEMANGADVVRVVMLIVCFISGIVTLTVLFMIRHKIANDVNDQMEQIGVLEALGYRFREISGAYILEYLILGATGCILGAVVTYAANPLMTYVLQVFEGHKTTGNANWWNMPMAFTLLLVLIVFTAFWKARTIKKYPPVIAFRKGIGTHHFGKNRLPLDKTGGNVNVRLGLKELLGNQRQNAGIFFCIVLMGLSIAFCILMADVFRDGGMGLEKTAGWENCDLYLIFEDTVNMKDAAAEIAELPEVRKATYMATNGVMIKGEELQAHVYADYDRTENIFVTRGWLPKKDNEVAIKESVAQRLGCEIGDGIMIEGQGIEKKYVISGYVLGLFDGAYFTEEGMSRIYPVLDPGIVNVYLKDGVKVEDFRELIKEKYGSSDEELVAGEGNAEGSLEERIRNKAEQQMALLISQYGAKEVNYAIKIGDQMISGGTGKMRIREITSFHELVGAQLGGLCRLVQAFSVILAIVVAIIIFVILNFLIVATVRRQRKQFGIQKAMGYTTKDVKKQMIARLMPVIIPGVILGTLLSVPVMELFLNAVLGRGSIQARYAILIPAAIGMILFTYASAWLSADKVKKVSVTELMTE